MGSGMSARSGATTLVVLAFVLWMELVCHGHCSVKTITVSCVASVAPRRPTFAESDHESRFLPLRIISKSWHSTVLRVSAGMSFGSAASREWVRGRQVEKPGYLLHMSRRCVWGLIKCYAMMYADGMFNYRISSPLSRSPGFYCSADNKIACPAGAYCLASCPGDGLIVDCNPYTLPQGSGPCPVGAYCPGQTDVATGIACPTGKYADVAGLSVCKDCAAGKYGGVTGASVCLDCPAGLHAPGTGSAVCTPLLLFNLQAATGSFFQRALFTVPGSIGVYTRWSSQIVDMSRDFVVQFAARSQNDIHCSLLPQQVAFSAQGWEFVIGGWYVM